MTKVLMTIAATAALACAQTTTPPTPTYTHATSYLSLTTAQLTSLEAIQTAERAALQPLMAQLRTAQDKLHTDMSAAASAATLAADTQAITDLQTQISAQRTTFMNQAIAVLSSDQAAKLAALKAAALLQPTIREAGMLNLLAQPAGGPGFGGPGFGGPGGGGPGGRGRPGPPPME